MDDTRPADYGIYADERDQRRFDEMAQRAGYPDAGNRGGAIVGVSDVEVQQLAETTVQETPISTEVL